jgi:hypothetical protein
MRPKFKCIINQDWVGVENNDTGLLDIARARRAQFNEAVDDQWQPRDTLLFTTGASLASWMMLVEFLRFLVGL